MLVVGGNLCVLWSLVHVWEATRVVGRRPMVVPPRLGGDRRGLATCVSCVRRGWGPRRGLRVVWRAVGAGILNAGANGGTARRRTAVSARIGTKRRCRGGGVPEARGMASILTPH